MRLMRMRIPLNVTPAVTGVIKCVPRCQIRSTMSLLEEARASCGNVQTALQRGPRVAECYVINTYSEYHKRLDCMNRFM